MTQQQSLEEVLTRTELGVAELNAKGYSKKEIADILHSSTRTIEAHFRNMYEKLEISKATELCGIYLVSTFKLDFEMPAMKKGALGIVLFLFMLPNILDVNFEARRSKVNLKAKNYATRAIRSTRRK
jgi:DNA-binding CsgD family transcriptional regulator